MRTLLIPALTLALCWPVSAQEATGYEEVIRTARTISWNAITKGQGSGVSVAIMDKGKLVYSEGLGVRERALNNPVDSHTRFNIGSTSKMFPVVAVLMLVDEGKVRLDDPVVKYIPEFKMRDERYRDITVRMLLNHSSGLPGSTFIFTFTVELDYQKVLLETLAREHLRHTPGEDSMYCNDGFTLAEILVERVSGQKFPDFLEQRVFQPLGMRDTGLSVGELPPESNRAETYDPKTKKKYPAEVVGVHGAGGFSSTAEDLCRFGNSFTPFGKQILSKNSLQLIRTAPRTPFGQHLRNRPPFMSMGWDFTNLSMFESKGLQVIAKGGNTDLYSGNLEIVPDQGLVVALLISGNAFGEGLTLPILVELLDKAGLARKQETPAVKPPVWQPFPVDFKRYQGMYMDQLAPFEARLSPDRKTFDFLPAKIAGSKQAGPAHSFQYSNGLLYEMDKKLILYPATIEGTDYFFTTSSGLVGLPSTPYGDDWLAYQQLKKSEHPILLFAGQPQAWLLRNMPASAILDQLDMVVNPKTYVDLDGYVNFSGMKKVESSSYAAVAGTHFRDQSELELWEDGGQRWARVSHRLYSPASPTPTRMGENVATIGPKGFNEWLELGQDSLLRPGIPAKGRVIVLAPEGELLFDNVLNSAEVFAPKGSRVLCAGPVGSQFTLTLR